MQKKEKEYSVLVVGAINKDVINSCFKKPIMGASNPCVTHYSFGGVGFNVARHLATMGSKVSLMSAVGEERSADDLIGEARRFNIDCTLVDRVANYCTATYYAFNDVNGELIVAFNDMRVLDQVNKVRFKARLERIDFIDVLVIDGNISADMFCFLLDWAEQVGVQNCIAVAASASKMGNIVPVLPRFDLVILNELEARHVLGDRNLEFSYQELLMGLRGTGSARFVITCGRAGVVYTDHENIEYFTSVSYSPAVVDTNGAGDAFAAGFIFGFVSGMTPKDSYGQGVRLANAAVQCIGAVPIRKNSNE